MHSAVTAVFSLSFLINSFFFPPSPLHVCPCLSQFAQAMNENSHPLVCMRRWDTEPAACDTEAIIFKHLGAKLSNAIATLILCLMFSFALCFSFSHTPFIPFSLCFSAYRYTGACTLAALFTLLQILMQPHKEFHQISPNGVQSIIWSLYIQIFLMFRHETRV